MYTIRILEKTVHNLQDISIITLKWCVNSDVKSAQKLTDEYLTTFNNLKN